MKFWGISAVVCCLLADFYAGQNFVGHAPVGRMGNVSSYQ